MSRPGRAVVAQRVRPRVLARLMAREAASLGVLLAVPLIVAAAAGAGELALRLGVMLVPVAAMTWWGRRGGELGEVHGIEALAVSALTFALGALLGVWPFMALDLDPMRALFEAMSAITSTGLTMVEAPETLPFTALFLRAWFQWYGGLAILVLAVGLVIGSGSVARRLGALDLDDASRVESIKTRSRRVLALYVAVTVVAWAVLALALWDVEAGLLYALAAVATGGFAPSGDSLAGISGLAAALVLGICLMSAVSYDQWLRTRRSGWRGLVADPELRLLVGLCLGAGLLIALFQWWSGAGAGVGDAFAHAISAQTTAGFSTVATDAFSAPGQVVLIVSMLVGGDVGSTAGGFKLVRLLVLAAVLRVIWLRIAAGPRAVLPLERSGARIEQGELENAVALAVVMATALLAAWLVFLAHGVAPLAALFETASALGTAGLSAGVVGADLAPALTAVLTGLMWLGRVELFAVLILVLPKTWRR